MIAHIDAPGKCSYQAFRIAISMAGFRQCPSVLLGMVREQSTPTRGRWDDGRWAEWAGRLRFHLDLTGLAESTDIDLTQLRRGLRTLIASRVLLSEDRENLRLNTDFDQWVYSKSGRPRLTPKMVAFCLDARS